MNDIKSKTWEELMCSINDAVLHPYDTAWDIFRYMKEHLHEMSSQEARSLMAIYVKIPLDKPSLLHSCMLGIALKMAARFKDFRLPQFLEIWGYDRMLRKDDRERHDGSDGKKIPSLKERTEWALNRYKEEHPELMRDDAIIGYVDRYDAVHKHYHIFDCASRHFVAKEPRITPEVGDFVHFVPVIPKHGNFKTAIVTDTVTVEEGRREFGLYDAKVKYVNKEKGYFYYTITSIIPSTPEGTITQEGSARLSLLPDAKVDQVIRILMFLKRGKDGIKRNAVVMVLGLIEQGLNG